VCICEMFGSDRVTRRIFLLVLIDIFP
jgi:hypothetical protein